MKRQLFYGFCAFLCIFLFAGCASVETLEPADITITELEGKMEAAMDPKGSFRKANSYVQREMLKIEGLFVDTLLQIDLKYKKPHFLRLTTLENNQPISAVIYNNGSAWSVNYTEKEVHEITGAELIRLNVLHRLSTPTEKYSQLFKDIKIFRCKIKDDPCDYYKIICNPDQANNTIAIYVNAEDFLPRRIDADLTIVVKSKKVELNYDSIIEAYESMDGVMIPRKSKSESDGYASTSTVFDYKLNVDIPDSEFLPPIFTENKLRDRMDRFGKGGDKARRFRASFDD